MSRKIDKTPKSEKKILTLTNVKETFNEAFRPTRDLRNFMQKNNGVLELRMEPDGTFSRANIVSGDTSKLVATDIHLSHLGGGRRFVADAVKMTESRDADHVKINLATKLAEEGFKPDKTTPAGNGRLSEINRLAMNLEKFRVMAEDWTDSEESQKISKVYILGMISRIFEILKEEAKILLTGKDYNPGVVNEALKGRNVPRWMFEKLTSKINVASFEAIDFLFPKNISTGFYLYGDEITEEMVIHNYVVTSGNEGFLGVARRCYENALEEVRGEYDNTNYVTLSFAKAKWFLIPKMSLKDLAVRYGNSNLLKSEDLTVPEGAVRSVLGEHLRKITTINDSWNRYFRCMMLRQTDKAQFWKKLVSDEVYKGWNVSNTRTLHSCIKEAIEGDGDLVPTPAWNADVFRFIAAEFGLFDPDSVQEFIEECSGRDFLTSTELTDAVIAANIEIDARNNERNGKEAEIANMPDSTGEEAEAKAAAEMSLAPVRKRFVESQVDWLGPEQGKIILRRGPPRDLFSWVKDKWPINEGTRKVFYLKDERPKAPTKEKMERFGKLFIHRTAGVKQSAVIGIQQKLTAETLEILAQIEAQGPVGKGILPDLKTWLTANFVGSPAAQIDAASVAYNHLLANDFDEDQEEED